MDSTEVVIGGVIVLVVARQMRSTFLEHLHDDRPTTKRDLLHMAASASNTAIGAAGSVVLQKQEQPADGTPLTRAGWADRARWLVSVAVRLAFFVWLYDVTDGAAFSPFGFAEGAFGGSAWQPVLIALGLTEVVARLAAIVVRRRRRRRRSRRARPVPQPNR